MTSSAMISGNSFKRSFYDVYRLIYNYNSPIDKLWSKHNGGIQNIGKNDITDVIVLTVVIKSSYLCLLVIFPRSIFAHFAHEPNPSLQTPPLNHHPQNSSH